MLNKTFKNKIFIFIFTFIIEVVMFYIFNYMDFGGRYLIPDMALSPVFGLMFGPVGGLGFVCANFVSECYWGANFWAILIDSVMLFLISILAYKLWYLIPPKESYTPKFNSLLNISKLLLVMFIVSSVYLLLFQISLVAFPNVMSDLYTLVSYKGRFSYAFNIFDFALIYCLIFISIFNIFKIPLGAPKNFKIKLNIPYRYFLIPFIIAFCIVLALPFYENIISESIVSYACFALFFIITFLFCLNTFDVGEVKISKDYSIIERIIVLFLIIILIFSYGIYSDLMNVVSNFYFVNHLNIKFIYMIVMGVVICISIALTLIHIYFVEKLITNPLDELSSAASTYVDDGKLKNPQLVRHRLESFMGGEDAISTLTVSFNSLIDMIKENVENLKKSTKEKEIFETELNIAYNIQNDMLSTDFEKFSANKPFELYASMNPAREVGGDFYDYFAVDEDNIVFVIGDVSGKSIPAALFMVKTMYLIKDHSKFQDNLSEVFETVNNISCMRNDDNLFVTSWIGKLNIRSGELSFVNAGHNSPLLRQNGGDFKYLEDDPNLVLGVMEDMPYVENKINLKPGDMLFLYTDGLTEANNNYQGFYGEERLKDVLNMHKDQDLSKIIHEINDDVRGFCDDEEQFDDLTMFIIKFKGD